MPSAGAPAYHPPGAYFTTLGPKEPNLAKRLFIPRAKLAFAFELTPPMPLRAIPVAVLG
jgi:hypothetical protein